MSLPSAKPVLKVTVSSKPGICVGHVYHIKLSDPSDERSTVPRIMDHRLKGAKPIQVPPHIRRLRAVMRNKRKPKQQAYQVNGTKPVY